MGLGTAAVELKSVWIVCAKLRCDALRSNQPPLHNTVKTYAGAVVLPRKPVAERKHSKALVAQVAPIKISFAKC